MLYKYLRIWWMLTIRSAQTAIISRFGAILFIVGKIMRFVFFFLFLMLLATKTNAIAGYTIWQVAFFFLSFNLVDTIIQFFLREVYRFRYYVVSGNFDYHLVKPMSPLFRSLFGGSDILDLPELFLIFVFIFLTASQLGVLTIFNIFIYIFLILNALFIALSFHIFVLSLGILTTEVDNTIMLYRDITQMGRVPIDIYKEPIKSIITFAIPVGVMMTFPTKALLGLLSWQFIAISFFITIIFFSGSILFWKYSLNHYSSASS